MTLNSERPKDRAKVVGCYQLVTVNTWSTMEQLIAIKVVKWAEEEK